MQRGQAVIGIGTLQVARASGRAHVSQAHVPTRVQMCSKQGDRDGIILDVQVRRQPVERLGQDTFRQERFL